MNLADFIVRHQNDDPADLVLHRERWPEVDVALAAECIASRRKLRSKVPEWYADPGIICPIALSAEQCSSTATARYKARLAASLSVGPSPNSGVFADGNAFFGNPSLNSGFFADGKFEAGMQPMRIADLTGGLGVDTWQFSKVAAAVLHNEMNPVLSDAAKGNLTRLGCSNISFSRVCISAETLPEVLDSFKPDLVFADPARRTGGRKVFLPEDCLPNVLELQDIVLERGVHMMLKLSPMADISLLLRKFHCVKELHIIQADGECKELLLLMEPGFSGEPDITVAVAGNDDSYSLSGQTGSLSFHPSEERSSEPRFISAVPSPGDLLFEPGAALSKSGAFNLLCGRFGLCKLGPSAHLYISDHQLRAISCKNDSENSGLPELQALRGLGKWFEIQEVAPFGKAALRDFATRWPDAEVSARNLPVNSDVLRSKMKVRGGGHTHIFGAGTAVGRLLIACRCI